MKKDFVKGIAVGCALSMASVVRPRLPIRTENFLKWLTLTSKLS